MAGLEGTRRRLAHDGRGLEDPLRSLGPDLARALDRGSGLVVDAREVEPPPRRRARRRIAAVTLILSGAQSRAVGACFALGWFFGVSASIVVFIAVVSAAETSDESPLWIAVPELVLGIAFLALAIHVWRGRSREASESPPWLGVLDRLTPLRSAALGVVLSAANPKNLALALGAAIALAEADLSSGLTTRTAALYILIGTAGVAVPVAISLVAPAWSGSVLGRFRAWLVRDDAMVLTVLGLVIGAKFVFDGLTDL